MNGVVGVARSTAGSEGGVAPSSPLDEGGNATGGADPTGGGADGAWSVEDVADATVRVVARLGRRFRPVRGDMGMGMLTALVTLDRVGPLRSGDLARREKVAAPTMTRMITALVDRGYAVRRPDPEDGRACLVDLTDEGRRAAAETRAGYASRVEEALRSLDGPGLRDVRRAMGLIEGSGLLG